MVRTILCGLRGDLKVRRTVTMLSWQTDVDKYAERQLAWSSFFLTVSQHKIPRFTSACCIHKTLRPTNGVFAYQVRASL